MTILREKKRNYNYPSVELVDKAFMWWRKLSIVDQLNLMKSELQTYHITDLTINSIVTIYNSNNDKK